MRQELSLIAESQHFNSIHSSIKKDVQAGPQRLVYGSGDMHVHVHVHVHVHINCTFRPINTFGQQKQGSGLTMQLPILV